MQASERRNLLLDFKDRLAELYIQKNAASKSGDWPLADSIDGEILEVKAQRAKIYDRGILENLQLVHRNEPHVISESRVDNVRAQG